MDINKAANGCGSHVGGERERERFITDAKMCRRRMFEVRVKFSVCPPGGGDHNVTAAEGREDSSRTSTSGVFIGQKPVL